MSGSGFGIEGYDSDDSVDPVDVLFGPARVYRGGNWLHTAVNARVALRNYDPPFYRNNKLGFRFARTTP